MATLQLLQTGSAQAIAQEIIENYLPKFQEKGICRGRATHGSCMYHRPDDGHVCVIGHFDDGKVLEGEYGPIDSFGRKLGIDRNSNRMGYLTKLQQLHDHNELDEEHINRLVEWYAGVI